MCSDAYVALIRISKVMLAKEIDNPVPVRPGAPFAISAHADYGWETVEPAGTSTEAADTSKVAKGGEKKSRKEKKAAKDKAKKEKAGATEGETKETPTPTEPAAPFQLRDINIDIPRGAFVVVCGRVGSGKSSLVQALIGEMKMLKGESYLGGSTSYCQSTYALPRATPS